MFALLYCIAAEYFPKIKLWQGAAFGLLVWLWSIEIVRRDLRNRITRQPDPEVPLEQPYR